MPRAPATIRAAADPLAFLHPAARAWFTACFDAPTPAQALGWPPIAGGASALLLAPTGSGKTLAAFLSAINRLMFAPPPPEAARCRVVYLSPIKALAVDVERNLRSPLTGIAATAQRLGVDFHPLVVGVRSGDTPQREREQMKRRPPDILITTPESLYLMLTSNARELLRSVETVIIDEIHSLVPTKRGTHLALSLERLDAARDPALPPLQRVGLSATQRPLEEVAAFLGGYEVIGDQVSLRPVTIVDAGRKPGIDLRIELPAEAVAAETPAPPTAPSEGSTAIQSPQKSIWPAIHPRLIELVRAHRSTMIFVNSRRLAERLAGALNELAGETLAMAHHGSIAREARADIEDRLKRGTLPAIVATSSMELGIDMGAVDLVIQLEAPPSIASGLQRIGRANHHVGGRSSGVLMPKFRGDLLACAAAARAMLAGEVESTRYPRNPLDVLAQQIVGAVAMDDWDVEPLFDRLRRAAPYAELPRDAFEGVLDMLSGRYPSDEFADLKPRLNYDRVLGQLRTHKGARGVAIANGGSIPDRGLFGVFLASEPGRTSRRVGELDEEMVFESRVGDVFLLGASSWRIEQITHDRVLVTPAPGEPGKMPFWRGDGPGRPLEFGRAIGALVREIAAATTTDAEATLVADHHLDPAAAAQLVRYIGDEKAAATAVPTDRTIVVQRFRDEIGDWRICILSPHGAAVHAPWAMAVRAQLLERHGQELDVVWSDDGIVFRLPEADTTPDVTQFFPRADELEDIVVARLAETSMFAARFRENAGRALLLTKRRPGQRSPLWALRRRSADLLAAAARFRDFPIVLETYRECLKDALDLPGCVDLLRRVEQRAIKIVEVETRSPSPFAAALLFNYVGNFMYEGDAPLAERRAQALTIDHARLKSLLGEAALRELLSTEAIAELEHILQRRDRKLTHPDDLHDLLRSLGDQPRESLLPRIDDPAALDPWLAELVHTRRIVRVQIGGQPRYIAAEDAGRYRDAIGVVSPPGLPVAFLDAVEDPLAELVARHARTHGPFRAEWLAQQLAVGVPLISGALRRLAARGKLVEGEFLPGGTGLEWCDDAVLRRLKRMSLARLRDEVEPVEPEVLARFLLAWQGIGADFEGPEAVLQAVAQLQGAPIPASVLEREVLPARVANYRSADLDALCGGGEIVWRGLRPLGPGDGYVALYLASDHALLAQDPTPAEGELAARVREALRSRGASFFADLQRDVPALPQDLLEALWDLVWAGEVSNDTLACLRSRITGSSPAAARHHAPRHVPRHLALRVRPSLPGSEGRWSLTTNSTHSPVPANSTHSPAPANSTHSPAPANSTHSPAPANSTHS
ncbi:MAG: DEAD/DEAH box helicase, partial [Myxococcales bacterium]|nr:DEAD/DEAH box helicase [Myxococcales bacterium]